MPHELAPARRLSTSTLPRDVVLFSTADWDHPFWTNKQRVACQLAARGFRVLYVESLGLRRPSAGTRDLGRIWRRVTRSLAAPREVAERIWVTSPLVVPAHASRHMRHFNDWILKLRLRRTISALRFNRPIVWTYNPLTASIARELDPSLLVYHAVDDLSAVPGVAGEAICEAERALARQADVVFATSTNLESRLKQLRTEQLRPDAVHFLPNVADYQHFSIARTGGPIPKDLAAIPRPRIGFIGAISSYKVDFRMIAEVARQRPSLHWVLVGQVGEGQPQTSVEALRLPNIHLLGPRDYRVLPDYLRGMDVATIPAARNPYTAAMFPMKFFEYLAAGKPVVAANVPALEPYRAACQLVDNGQDFAAAIDRALRGEGPDQAIGDKLARTFTWDWRMAEMIAIIERAWAGCTKGLPPARAA